MIVTIDGNPKLIREVIVDDIKIGKSNVLQEESIFAQGIGTNCSNIIAQSKEKVCLVTFIDKVVGPLYEEGIKNVYHFLDGVPIKEKMQEKVILSDGKTLTTFTSSVPRLTREEINHLFLRVKGYMEKDHILLLPFQERAEFGSEFITKCLAETYEQAIPNIVCARKEELEKIVEEKPYFLIVTKDDLESFTKLKILFSHEAQKAANILFDKGVGNVLIINKETGAILCTKQESIRLRFEKFPLQELNINYIATGVAIGLERKYDPETTLKLSMALGLVDESFGRKTLDVASIKEKMKEFTVKEI